MFHEVLHCFVNPCENGGTCQEVPGSQTFECTCTEGYMGSTCSTGKFTYKNKIIIMTGMMMMMMMVVVAVVVAVAILVAIIVVVVVESSVDL